ncbi:MAG: MATE family efflux transporter [Arenicellales bacterium]|jgi:MATE family multidrug resistance protein|nr:MATE family efflux transporter [Arenicellales bacterium]|tara:strand:- start:2074 stop:3417 length:1344 start_codon:yes stop_codon:yes gene_type:complete
MVRKCWSELAGLFSLGLPIIFTQLLQVSLGTMAVIMMGRVGSRELAAVGLGATLWVFVWLGCMGLLMGLSPTIAQHHGAGRKQEIREVFQQGLWLALIVGILAFVVMRVIGQVMRVMRVDPEVIPLVDGYLVITSWSMPAVCVYLALRFFCEATGNSRPMMIIQLLLLPLGFFGNYLLIYGKLGFPAMGVDGAALTFAVGLVLAAVLMTVYVFRARRYRQFGLFQRFRSPNLIEIRNLLRLGVPISVNLVLDSGFYGGISLLMGQMGHAALAAHQLVINYATLIFMIPVGLSSAIMVRVGQSLGRSDFAEVRFRGWLGITASTVLIVPSVVFVIFFPEIIISVYTSDPEVVTVATALLMVAAFFQIFDGLYMTGAGALRGMKDTKGPMWISILAYWLIGFPIAWFLGSHLGPEGLWYGMVAGIGLTAILLGWRFELKSVSLRDSHAR